MRDTNEIVELIEEFYPIEYDLAGRSTVENIAQTTVAGKNIDVISSRRGSNFEVGSTILFLCAVAEGISALLDIIDRFRSKHQSISVAKVKQELLASVDEDKQDKMDTEVFDQIIQQVVDQTKPKN
ncbi:hypothetical protein [Nostoc sp. NMS9]|uniref:hypothetical protein n=1 Tax=Nostoc sp. NMS9 TaxID=2815393 RepID=UPI0025D168BD|nr:hypothetical protein [Nostoc sp. NMS9]MBN3943181.1 hypothetical protein [Nostoc sp. NMS9]